MALSNAQSDVAADFEDSLQHLMLNNKYEISNLTVIAKENCEHAMAISRVLENHIKKTPSTRKLPALYVLDSIVKNVGSPYVIYFRDNLYNTFFDAFTVVDNTTRKHMESMLKTWQEPVVGSMDSKPVFPIEITRAIQNTLIKWRMASHQQQQDQVQRGLMRPGYGMPPRPQAVGVNGLWRDTSTPPQPLNGYHSQGANHQGYQVRHPSTVTVASTNPKQQPPYYQSQPPVAQYTDPASYAQTAYNETQVIMQDVESLVSAARIDFSRDYHNPVIQQKLKALLDLQTILGRQQLPPSQLQAIRSQVTSLKNAGKPPTPINGGAYMPPYYPQPPTQPPVQTPTPLQQPPHTSSAGSASLAQLLASMPQASQPQSSTSLPLQTSKPPADLTNLASLLGVTSTPPIDRSVTPSKEDPLLASLRAAGLIPSNGPSEPPRSVSTLLQNPALAPPPAKPVIEKIPLTSASLKTPRPHLLKSLFSAQPSQCRTCGRRFPATKEGKERKARHLDYHFRTNQRLADSARRGMNRSWYLDELEWMKYREVDDSDPVPDDKASGDGTTGSTAKDLEKTANEKRSKQYIKAPADAAVGNYACPICQEKFETTWHDEAQEWVWMDAINAGDRVYHASCHEEVAKANDEPPKVKKLSPILGKRKGEDQDTKEESPAKRQSLDRT
ncbi:MAG: hypothetical protein M1828_007529 [Chrysothrix sp. TS-e1954]|nr:MAG: hypothetical protein M1828_007529 [Chrysothrix sp. TS-e1954]